MKILFRIILGVIFVTAGVDAAIFSGYQMLQGQLIWIFILLAGCSLTIAGVRLISGDRLRDIFDDLFFNISQTP